MWIKIIKIVAQVAMTTGATDWAKAWLKKRLQKQIAVARKKAEDAIILADEQEVQGVYGVTVVRKRRSQGEVTQ